MNSNAGKFQAINSGQNHIRRELLKVPFQQKVKLTARRGGSLMLHKMPDLLYFNGSWQEQADDVYDVVREDILA